METTDTQPELKITRIVQVNLFEIAKWAKFISVLGFIILGLLVIIGTFAFLLPLNSSLIPNNRTNSFSMMNNCFFGFMYILIAFVYFFPIKYLYLFSIKLKRAIVYNNQAQLTKSLFELRKHFRYIGILTLSIFTLYLVMIIIPLIIKL